MIVLVTLLCIPFAYGCALVVRRRFLPRRPDLNVCASCGYSLMGLPSAGLCPECGNAKKERKKRTPRAPVWPLLTFLVVPAVPVATACVIKPTAVQFTFFVWLLGTVISAGCAGLAGSRTPRPVAIVLTLVVFGAMLIGAVCGTGAATWAWASQTGGGEYGADFAIDADLLASPMLALNAALWLFVVVPLIIIATADRWNRP